ncbi:hypothetical protein Gasu2_66840 [Galdieria sulphuraria]|uniref:Uncharacterized protein n=1 Tax=Galdieria sulphuraria TaxID=130081 RepID=M2XT67_GALSU|nr:uncharacterized protein Gasu_55200 [Galdieria sulphuraria]EME26833.1 hypothetical protein Gasu_55200 [Galdieria sulphuraria]GJD12610.1 hypothetical protein Gasu2_66840 [Galdieria sulphuraria]|eukprot:XP_005703353.1 hypothetical protein Gasu_55200 [Galdieria sulphuraria]
MDTRSALRGIWNQANFCKIIKNEVFFSSNERGILQQRSREHTRAPGQCTEKNVCNMHTGGADIEIQEAMSSDISMREGIVPQLRRSLSLPTFDMNTSSLKSVHCFQKESFLYQRCVRRKEGSESFHIEFLNVYLKDEAVVINPACLARKETKLTRGNSLRPSTEDKLNFLSCGLYSCGDNVMSDKMMTSVLTCSQQSQKRVTLYLLDWDDTFFPSTALASFESFSCLPKELKICLRKLECTIMMLLEALNSTGFVAIVTNANADWVEFSCRHFMPKLLLRLEDLGILILSARTLFGSDSMSPISSCPSDWKAAAFLKLMIYFFSSTATENSEILKLNKHSISGNCRMTGLNQQAESRRSKPPIYSLLRTSRLSTHAVWFKAMHALDCIHQTEKKRNENELEQSMLNHSNWKFEKAVLLDSNSFVCHHIIAMGDSCFEQNAMNTLREQYRQAHFKFIHFVSEPSIMALFLELKSVYFSLHEISSFAGNLEIRLNVAQ